MDKKASNKRINSKTSSKNSNKKNQNKKVNNTKINKKDITGQKARNKKKKRKIWKIVLLVILLILLICGGVFAYRVYKNGWGLSGMLATVVGHDEYTKKDLKEFRCLVLGISTDEEGALLTDTIMVASYNPNTQKATLLSIPRDTFTGKNTKKAVASQKINSLYSINEDPQDVLDAVNDLTGLGLEYYVIVKTEGFIQLVDAIGGVTFNVPIDMDYDDTSQDLHIHLKAGEQLLDGDKAEQLVRFRHNNDGTTYPEEYGDNDLGRMKTQREFMMAVLKQTAKVENIFKLGEILDVAEQNVTTNINFDVAKDYIPYIVEFNTENLLTATLPGTTPPWDETNGVSIFVADENETEKMVQELFYDRDLEQEQTEGTSEDGNTVDTNTVSKADVTIEVLNGSGNSEKLNQAIKELEGAGYEVTRKGVTNSTSKTTIINKQNVADTILTNLEQVLGIGEISDGTSSSSKVDITIVLGKDYV